MTALCPSAGPAPGVASSWCWGREQATAGVWVPVEGWSAWGSGQFLLLAADFKPHSPPLEI